MTSGDRLVATSRHTPTTTPRRTVPRTPVSRPTITGVVLVDITDLGAYSYDAVRHRLWDIQRAPRGAKVELRVGPDATPTPIMWGGLDFSHVDITVVGDVDVVGRWVRALRGEPEPSTDVWSSHRGTT